jgi:hypothetical protein
MVDVDFVPSDDDREDSEADSDAEGDDDAEELNDSHAAAERFRFFASRRPPPPSERDHKMLFPDAPSEINYPSALFEDGIVTRSSLDLRKMTREECEELSQFACRPRRPLSVKTLDPRTIRALGRGGETLNTFAKEVQHSLIRILHSSLGVESSIEHQEPEFALQLARRATDQSAHELRRIVEAMQTLEASTLAPGSVDEVMFARERESALLTAAQLAALQDRQLESN